MISAGAVGSRSAKVRLPARATTGPSRTMTQPTGTSPRAPAARASSSAKDIKEVMVPCGPLCYQPCSTSRTMNGTNDQHKPGERVAKVIARAGLASRREAEAWIVAGRVAVNGAVIATPALNVTAADRIAVDG